MLIEKKKIFYLDSRDRISGTDNNFNIALNLEQDDDFDSVVVLQCQIPKSYYLVRDGLNTFRINENGTISTVFIPIGNFNRKSFAIALEQALNQYTALNITYNVTYDNSTKQGDTGKYLFSYNALIPVSFIFTENVYEQLGFDANTTVSFTLNPFSNIYELYSKNVIKLQIEDCLYIHSDICNNPEGNDILQEIYCSTGESSFSNIYYSMVDLESCSKKMVRTNNNIYNFQITNEDDQPVNFNGINMFITVMCYKKNNIWNLIKGYIKYKTLKD
jgi:hypothetical protein